MAVKYKRCHGFRGSACCRWKGQRSRPILVRKSAERVKGKVCSWQFESSENAPLTSMESTLTPSIPAGRHGHFFLQLTGPRQGFLDVFADIFTAYVLLELGLMH